MRVLSIDGGGIRGIIPAMILAEIEQRAGVPICKLFDLIAGTSTGGILSLALTKPDVNGAPEFKAQDLISFYRDNGPQIFSSNLWHRIGGGFANAFGPHFPPDGLEQVLSDCFGMVRLSQALTPVLIPSYDLRGVVIDDKGNATVDTGGQPVFFSSEKAKGDPTNFEFFMKDVARATSAAPSYFPPFRISTASGSKWWMEMVDGGVIANNPAVCAYTEAIKLGANPDQIFLLSLGTGELQEHFDLKAALHWGELAWIQPVLKIFMDGASCTVDHQLSTVFSKTKLSENYHRLQVELTQEHTEMSDASQGNLDALAGLAKHLISSRNRELTLICDRLKKDDASRATGTFSGA